MTTALNPRTGRAFEQTTRGFDCYTFKKPLPFEAQAVAEVLEAGRTWAAGCHESDEEALRAAFDRLDALEANPQPEARSEP